MPIIEAIKKMKDEELKNFIKAIYQAGWIDGQKNVDKSSVLFTESVYVPNR